MSTLHSPLDTTAGMQTKNQSPKQKGFASYLPISPTPLLRKRLGTIPAYEHNSHAGNGAKYSTGRGEIGQKKRAQRTRRLILPFSLTPGRGIGIILPQIQRRGGNRDGERNGGVFGLREGDGGERWGYYLEYLGCEGRRGRAYAVSQPSQAGHSEVMGSHTHLLHLPLPPPFRPRYIFLRRSLLSYRKAHSQRLQMRLGNIVGKSNARPQGFRDASIWEY
ncbi:uncharacterized protein IAS62_002312 [Cryptococcus decagattii]|uniref:Uncharacterized protein n=1 Tax=Cryptococcus decagattii TaxID=1859122 RepID=A0ABZ2AR68_9TREE